MSIVSVVLYQHCLVATIHKLGFSAKLQGLYPSLWATKGCNNEIVTSASHFPIKVEHLNILTVLVLNGPNSPSTLIAIPEFLLTWKNKH